MPGVSVPNEIEFFFTIPSSSTPPFTPSLACTTTIMTIRTTVISTILTATTTLAISLRGGDFGCASATGDGCVKPDMLSVPGLLNPGTIQTSTDSSGFITASQVDGDSPDNGPDGQPLPATTVDPAEMYTIQSPSMEMPPTPPPLIVCSYEQCTTSSTTPMPR